MDNELTVSQRAVVALGQGENEKALTDLAAASATITAITNADSYKQVHSARMALKGRRVESEKLGKSARDDATAFGKAVIAEEKRLIGLIEPEEKRLEKLQTDHDNEIEAERQRKIDAELARVEDIQLRIAELRGNPALNSTSGSELIRGHIADLTAIPVDDSFMEFGQWAEDAKANGLMRLNSILAGAREHEEMAVKAKAEREELARLRAAEEQRQTEARAAQAELDKQARQAREQEERDAAAHRAAQQAKLDKRQRELDAAERQRDAEERRLAAERQRQADAQAEIDRQRQANEAAETARKTAEAPPKPSGKRPSNIGILSAATAGIVSAFGCDLPPARDWLTHAIVNSKRPA